jgi:hypothetical protein
MHEAREAAVTAEFYRSGAYAGYLTVFSQIEQLRWVNKNQLQELLYVGVGSGFVPAYLRAQGIRVTTVDINPALRPDLLCDVTRLSQALQGRTFQGVMVCEVLEHLPFESFQRSLVELASVARERVFITLPVFSRFLFRACGAVKIGQREVPVGFWLPIPKRHLPAEHAWELGSTRETSRRNVRQLLESHFAHVRDFRLRVNPYHHAFDLVPKSMS